MQNQIILLQIKCPFCGTTSHLSVDAESYNKFKQGELVQQAFPNMSTYDRELLITGLCINCQNQMFKTEF